jgi:aspartyl/asparaginyl beta-hydroxylase (cupin superfamily)
VVSARRHHHPRHGREAPRGRAHPAASDSHPSFGVGHRIHVPIVTNPRVRFMIDGRPYQLQVGEAYEVNNQKMHSVMNKGDTDRINFIFDYVPPSAQQGRVAVTGAQAVPAGS